MTFWKKRFFVLMSESYWAIHSTDTMYTSSVADFYKEK